MPIWLQNPRKTRYRIFKLSRRLGLEQLPDILRLVEVEAFVTSVHVEDRRDGDSFGFAILGRFSVGEGALVIVREGLS